MTITNHIRMIEALTTIVIEHVDDREYENAHGALDDIATRVRLAHEHIDNLQAVTPSKLSTLRPDLTKHLDHLQTLGEFGTRSAGGD